MSSKLRFVVRDFWIIAHTFSYVMFEIIKLFCRCPGLSLELLKCVIHDRQNSGTLMFDLIML